MQNLTEKTISGFKWSYVSTGFILVMQIGYTAVMARLILPAAFGIVALATALVQFGSYFAQMGLSSAIIQKENLTEREIRLSFTISTLLGILFFVISCLISRLVLYFIDSTTFMRVYTFVSFSYVTAGLSITAVGLLRRELRIKPLAIAEISSFFVGNICIGIYCAYNGFGVWSLVFAAISQNLIMGVVAYSFCRHKVKPLLNWSEYKPLFTYGKTMTLIGFLEFIDLNMDTFVIGKLLGDVALGIYNRAMKIVALPIYNITTSVSKIVFSSFSRIQNEHHKLNKFYRTTIVFVSLIIIPLCLAAAISSNEIVLIVLGKKWIGAIPIIKIISFVVILRMLSHFGGVLCDATAKLHTKLILQVSYVIFLLIIFTLFRREGLKGLAAALLIAEFVRYIAYTSIIRKILQRKSLTLLSYFRPALLVGAILSACLIILKYFLSYVNFGIWIVFILECLITAVVFGVTIIVWPLSIVKNEIIDLLSSPSMMNKFLFFRKIFLYFNEIESIK